MENKSKLVVGYQVINDYNDLHPNIPGSWIVIPKKEALSLCDATWSLSTIYHGDIEEGNKTFEGHPDCPTEINVYVNL